MSWERPAAIYHNVKSYDMSSGAPLTAIHKTYLQTFLVPGCDAPAARYGASPIARKARPSADNKMAEKIQSAIYMMHGHARSECQQRPIRHTTPLVPARTSCSSSRPAQNAGRPPPEIWYSRSVYGAPDKNGSPFLTSYERFHRPALIAVWKRLDRHPIAAVLNRSVYPTVRRFRIRSP